MISQLSEKTQRIIGIGMVIAMPIIILSGLIYGIYLDAQDPQSQDVEEVEEKTDVMYEYDDEATQNEPDNESNKAFESSSNDSVYVPDSETMQDAQSVATDFIMAYLSFDQDDPKAYLEQSKPYMTKQLYDFYAENPKRGTLVGAQVEVIDTEVTPGEFEEERQIWNVNVTAEKTGVDGEIESSIIPYSVLLQADNNTWKVDGVKINE